MSTSAIINAIIEILTGGLTGIGSAMGQAFSQMTTAIAFTGSGESQALSPFFVMVLIFAAVSLGLALVRWVLNFLTSLGARNR